MLYNQRKYGFAMLYVFDTYCRCHELTYSINTIRRNGKDSLETRAVLMDVPMLC